MARRNSPLYVNPTFGGSAPRYADYTPEVFGRTGAMSVHWDFRPILRLAARMAGEFYNADPAILQAHTEMAQWVQHYASQALIDAIEHRGPRNIGPREQRGSKLVDAIIDDRVRSVDIQGFAVGYLDRVEGVEKYWRRIEEGSDTQVGQVFYGAFLSKGGKWHWPTSDEGAQVDPKLYKFASGPLTQEGAVTSYKNRLFEGDGTRGRTPLVRIERAIPAYHYLAQGYETFLGKEGKFSDGKSTRETVMSTYTRAFDEHGMDFLARWARRFGGARPAPPSVTKGFGSFG